MPKGKLATPSTMRTDVRRTLTNAIFALSGKRIRKLTTGEQARAA